MKKLLLFSAFMLSVLNVVGQNYYMASPEGFGAATTGGGNATPVTVTTYTDLKAKIRLSTPQVILVSGTIEFSASELQISELVTNKTIIGLPGARLINNKQTQSGSGILNLKPGSSNVIIRNLIFEGPGAYDTDGRDNLTAEGCTNLWVDHCEFQDGTDGNFDIKSTSDNVTVSWCKFTYLKPAVPGGPGGSNDHRFSNLVGSSSSDAPTDGHYSVTFQNCYWAGGVKSRMPRARNAELHILNCYYNTNVSGSTALGLGGGINNLTCYVENSNFANVSTVYSNASGDGGTVSLQFDNCINGVSNVGSVSKPSYNYTVIPVNDVATYITDASCGAGATLQVTATGEISSSCDSPGEQIVNATTYDFRDGGVIAGNGGSADGKLTLSGTYAHHGDTYGLNMKVGATVSIQVDGSSTIRFLGSKHSGLDVKGTASTDGDLGTQVSKVTNDLTDTFDFVYSGLATTLTFTTVTGTGNDLYLPTIEVIPAQLGKDFTTPGKNIVYNFDLRDQSIVPSSPPNNIEVGLFKMDAGCCNGLGLNGSQHGITFKDGNIITLKVKGNSYIRIGADQFSGGSITASSSTGAFDISSQSNNTGSTFSDGTPLYVDFLYVGNEGTVVLEHTGGGTTYLPFIQIAPVPYNVSLTPWVQKSGTITINGTEISLTTGSDESEAATVAVSAGTVFSTTNEEASVEIDLAGQALDTFTPTLTGDIASTSVNGNVLTVNFSDTSSNPSSYLITISDSSAEAVANPGETYTYNFADGSVLPQVSYTSLRYETFKTQDKIVTINSNTTVESGQFGYHDATHGGVFFPGNSFDIIVAGDAIITFIVDQYGSATDAVFEFTDADGNALGSMPAQNIAAAVDGVPMNFSYTGPAGKVTATLVSAGFPSAEIYLHGMSIENAAVVEPSNGKIDVWDFGAEQLDVNLYNNKLDESKINAWYDSSITAGSSNNVMPSSWTEGVLTWVGGSNDRLRTSNTNLTRYDENLSGVSGYSGRIYVNATGATGRYMGLTLSEDDEVTLAMIAQNANGNIHFTYVPDPAAQDDVVKVSTSGSITTVKFVAKSAGSYRIYDDSDKPSYYRIERKDATYKTLTGNVDISNAAGIPTGYSIVFTNEAGKTWSVIPSGGTYSVDLPQDYTYNLSLVDANGYIISSAKTIFLEESTTTFDVTIIQVDLYTVSGNITGLGSEISNVVITYTSDPAANRIYVPEPVIDIGASTYTVELEPNIEYTISAEGVNDFEILANTITIGNANQSADIDFTPKPVHNVTIDAPGLDATQLSKLELTFSNLNEEGYTYTFSDVSTVALRDGVYTVDYAGLDEYAVELALTSNLTVSGADTSKQLTFNPVTNWSFDDKIILSTDLFYKGLGLDGARNEIAKGHLVCSSGNTVVVPINPGEKILVTYYFTAAFSIEGGDLITTNTQSTSTFETVEYVYTGTSSGTVTISCSGSVTTYLTNIAVKPIVAFSEVITVGVDKDYQTINDALDAIAEMDRPNDERVTVMIDPGNYEEMIVINSSNVTLKNAAAIPSIALLNQGVDIDANAVRITSYYGTGYNYFSQGTDNKWSAEALAVNTANGYQLYENKSGTTNGSYWCATVVVLSGGFVAEDIIMENSFNQYISQKESEDTVVVTNASPSAGARPTTYGDTSVQNRGLGYVERAAAIGVASNVDKVILNTCRVVGRQDSFYGGHGSRVVVYKGAMMGAVDYIFGGMTAVFYKTDFVLNTSDTGSDIAYITAAQQNSGNRGFLMYECNVKSAVPGVETASTDWGKPGYFGRPWAATTSEVVFYKTNIDASQNASYTGQSMIFPLAWQNTLGGESSMMYERSTNELSGEDNSASRASWSTVLTTDQLTDGTEITTFNFTKGNDGWDPIPALNAAEDSDFDGIIDSLDNCPDTANPDQVDFNNNGIGDVCEDSDGDGLIDSEDNCPDSPAGAIIDVFGCELFELPANNFSLVATSVSCNSESDGSISISSQNTDYTYNVTVSGNGFNGTTSFTSSTSIGGLKAGTYRVCITIEGKDNYEQCYNVTVQGPQPLSAFSRVSGDRRSVSISLSGSNSYNVNHNGMVTTTSESSITIDLVTGLNTIEISTDYVCQGKFLESIFLSEDVLVTPNPTRGNLQVYISGEDSNVDVSLFDLQGRQYFTSSKSVSSSRIINLDLTNLSNGLYHLQLNGKTVKKSIKIIKK